jgi:MFS family permease
MLRIIYFVISNRFVKYCLGFLGDKIGFKPILLISLIGTGISGTLMDFTPRYKEYLRYPSAVLSKINNNDDGGSFTLTSIEWPTGYPLCDLRESHNITLCQNSPPYKEKEFYQNIEQFLECNNANGELVPVGTLDVSLFDTPWNNSLAITDTSNNGTFCELFASFASNTTHDEIYCDIVDHPDIGKCVNLEGSHAVTFSIYLLLRILWNLCVNVMFNLTDGTAMHLAKTHSGDYAWVLAWNTLAGVFSPMISGALIEDSADPSGD